MYAPAMPSIAFMHSSIDKILARLMADKGLKQLQLSKETSVGQSTISRILKPNGPRGIKVPTDSQVRPLAEFFGLSTDQLRGYEAIPDSYFTGTPTIEARAGEFVGAEEQSPGATRAAADMVLAMLEKKGSTKGLSAERRDRIAMAVAETLAEYDKTNVITVDFARPGRVGDEIRIAHYDVKSAMGAGQVAPDYPEMFEDVIVSQQHLRELGVTYNDPNHLKMMTGVGQSMEPTIRHLDPLIVDVSIREFVGDGIYAFWWQGHFYTKRLQVADADHFEMISDNPRHKDRLIRMDETYIQCRILLVWNAKKV